MKTKNITRFAHRMGGNMDVAIGAKVEYHKASNAYCISPSHFRAGTTEHYDATHYGYWVKPENIDFGNSKDYSEIGL